MASATDVPTRTVNAINSDINAVSNSHIYSERITLNPEMSLHIIRLPYSNGIVWTDFKVSFHPNNRIPISLTFKSNEQVLSYHERHRQNTWHPLMWPIPSVNSVYPIDIYIETPYDTPATNELSIKVAGFENVFPARDDYILVDPNGEAAFKVVRTNTTNRRAIGYFCLEPGCYDLDEDDFPINCCYQYIHRAENPHLYDSDSDSRGSW